MIATLLAIGLAYGPWLENPGDVTTPPPPPLPTYIVNGDGMRVDCAPGFQSCDWE